MRHYEVVYLIHEKHAEEVALVNEKVQGDSFPPSFIFCAPFSVNSVLYSFETKLIDEVLIVFLVFYNSYCRFFIGVVSIFVS